MPAPKGGVSAQSTAPVQALADLAALLGRQSDLSVIGREALEFIGSQLSVGHALIWENDRFQRNPLVHAGMGWDQTLQLMVAHTASEQQRKTQPPADGRHATIGAADHQPQCRLITLSPPCDGISACLAIAQPIGNDHLGLLVGYTRPIEAVAARDRILVRTISHLLQLAFGRVRAEQKREWSERQILQSKAQWEGTVDALPQLICVLDRGGKILRSNRTVEKWGLGSVSTVRQIGIHECLHPGCELPACAVRENWETAWSALATSDHQTYALYDPVLDRELEFSLFRNRNQAPGTGDPGHAFLVVEDIRVRKEAERTLKNFNRELRAKVREKTFELSRANWDLREAVKANLSGQQALSETRDQYSRVVDNRLTGIYLSTSGRIQFANARLARMFGYAESELTGMETAKLFVPDIPDAEQRPGAGFPADTPPAPPGGVMKGIRKDGSELWLEVEEGHPLSDASPVTLGQVVDITARIKAEQTIREVEWALQDLSARLLTAQEEERRRIAGELHDGIGQSLSAIRLSVEKCLGSLEGELQPHQEALLRDLSTRTRHAMEEVRRIAMDLRPSLLDDLGIIATINWFCREQQALLPDIEIDKRLRVEESDIRPEWKIAIFRILQEAFNNIVKHARASEVKVTLSKEDNFLIFWVCDDGIGFDPATLVESGRGFGLSSMRERAKLSGGLLDLSTGLGKGTAIEVSWPLEAATPED